MRAAGPAARPPHPFFELRAHPFDMLPSCLIFLDGDGPADPFVARKRRHVFPCRPCLRIGRKRPSEISREVMYNSFGDSNSCHSASHFVLAVRAALVGPSSFRSSTNPTRDSLRSSRKTFFQRGRSVSLQITSVILRSSCSVRVKEPQVAVSSGKVKQIATLNA